ncbi:MAG: hypothetical protein FJ296_05485, partial [Planctomycetes bacterium]|nr:hypothetical protein [Planctomycetota bacterium]
MNARLAWALAGLVLALSLLAPPWPADLTPDPRLSGGQRAAPALLELLLPGAFRPVVDAPARFVLRNPLADALKLP